MSKRSIWRLALLFAAGCSVLGCGPSRQSLQKNLGELEKEIARLKSERINLEAHATALDDKIVVLEKKLQRCGEEPKPELKVVRLQRDDEASPSENEASARTRSDGEQVIPETISGSEPRPRLVLYGGREQSPASETEFTPKIDSNSMGQFSKLPQDNLGVVPLAEGIDNPAEVDPAMEAFHSAYRLYSNKRYDEALDAFENFFRDNPKHEYADDALFWRGESYLAKKELFKGIGEFERLIRRYPHSEQLASALFRIGFAYDELRDRGKALEYYFRVVDNYPDTDAARRASRRVAALEGKGASMSQIRPTVLTR